MPSVEPARWWAPWALTLRNLLLPVFCQQCGNRLMTEENGYFCPTCWEMSPRIEPPYCDHCGRPHPAAAGFDPRPCFPCAECRDQARTPIRRIYGAAVYAGAIDAAIKLMKFNGKRRLAGPLSEVMTEFASREMPCDKYERIVPVPLHVVRERERGFNQSRLLAEGILAAFPNAVLDDSLRRIRPTRVQSRLTDPAGRRANVKGAFAVTGDTMAGRDGVAGGRRGDDRRDDSRVRGRLAPGRSRQRGRVRGRPRRTAEPSRLEREAGNKPELT